MEQNLSHQLQTIELCFFLLKRMISLRPLELNEK